jgi:hypothetical protein
VIMCPLETVDRIKHTLATTLHHLIIALLVGSDEDDLGTEAVPHVLEKLNRVRAATALLGVPQNHTLWRNVLVDEVGDGRAKGLLLIRADPDEEPMSLLSAYALGIVCLDRSSSAYQFGLWMQVDSAAPMPVPVQMRIPRLNMAEACPTPAVDSELSATSCSQRCTETPFWGRWTGSSVPRQGMEARSRDQDLPNLSSRVQSVLGGFSTRPRVKSPCTPQIM